MIGIADMKLYRFSPITDKKQLLEAIQYVHVACHRLCRQSFSEYLPVAGNVGIFCHYDSEYEQLTTLRQELTEPSDNVNQKYFRLHEPIVVPAQDGIPEATYSYLYIRKPDPYRAHVGDVDFFVGIDRYAGLKQSLENGEVIAGARLFPRADLDMIELFNPDVDVLGYVSTATMTEKVRKKL
jgi:hypothetical protein